MPKHEISVRSADLRKIAIFSVDFLQETIHQSERAPKMIFDGDRDGPDGDFQRDLDGVPSFCERFPGHSSAVRACRSILPRADRHPERDSLIRRNETGLPRKKRIREPERKAAFFCGVLRDLRRFDVADLLPFTRICREFHVWILHGDQIAERELDCRDLLSGKNGELETFRFPAGKIEFRLKFFGPAGKFFAVLGKILKIDAPHRAFELKKQTAGLTIDLSFGRIALEKFLHREFPFMPYP